ncbi:unnamed protein product, partial [Rotaria sp. Silwood2]
VDEEKDEEDEPEEGFVQTDIHDTTAEIYRTGRSKFSIAQDEMDPVEMEKYLKERCGPKSRVMREDQIPDEIIQQSL